MDGNASVLRRLNRIVDVDDEFITWPGLDCWTGKLSWFSGKQAIYKCTVDADASDLDHSPLIRYTGLITPSGARCSIVTFHVM
jgi:hypothetical protein